MRDQEQSPPRRSGDIDHEELRRRYRAERDKRIRSDGNDQYLEPSGRYAHLLDDPYVPRVDREPISRSTTVALIGGGFAGLSTGARLKEAGITDVTIIEGGGDVGGAWYWNRYPGAMCDTAAMIYLPLLEETAHVPSQKYTFAPEIFAHAQRIASTFDLYEGAIFSTEVTSLDWDEASSTWRILTDRGDEIEAKYVAMGTGPLHRPKLPGIPGIQSFEGTAFHTSRWDYSSTGGDAFGAALHLLGDKRVGIIGTGATAVQCVPPLARSAAELYVFQRTPSAIDERNNHPIDPDWFATLNSGWQREWLLNFAILQTGGFADEDLVKDGWTDISQRIRDRVVDSLERPDGSFRSVGPEDLRAAYEDSDDEKMTELRARVDAIVEDSATADALKPWYRQLCKRPCFHDEYLQSFNLPSTHLVDTDGMGVAAIDSTGVWVGETHYELDILIFASGFEVGTSHARRSGFETTGRDSTTLSEYWVDGMRSLHGLHVRGFPNLFILGPSQGANLISNITHNLTEAGTTVAAVIKHAEEVGARSVEATEEAENAWVEMLESTEGSFLGNPDCTPGYYNNEGRPIGRRERLNGSGFPAGPVAYFAHIDAWRSSGDYSGLEFSTS